MGKGAFWKRLEWGVGGSGGLQGRTEVISEMFIDKALN